MNRAMFSGVAGMKAHQSKMDVIGNNIANVNTYGYKTQRAVFSDIFYQTIRNASAGTANQGGTNPSTMGYGSSLNAVQTQMSQSSMQNTGFGMDVAIMGEGFLQVMDGDGNIFYTKAGLLDYDANGYLTDINGNFVLGASGADGVPGSQKIKLDDIGSVDPNRASITEAINGVNYTITASNPTAAGNVSINLASDASMPAGLKAQAIISDTGIITVQLNAHEEFASMSELNDVINEAITEANKGKQHAGGIFTISSNQDPFNKPASAGNFTGAGQANFLGGAKLTGVNTNFPNSGKLDFTVGTVAPDGSYQITATVAGKAYTANVLATGGAITLKTNDPADGTISMTMPTGAEMMANLGATAADVNTKIAATLNNHGYRTQAFSPAQANPLTGAEIIGSNFGTKAGSISDWEKGAFGSMFFKKASPGFTGSGTVNPGDFTASYITDANGDPAWEVKFVVDGTEYKGQINAKTTTGSLLLENSKGDYIEVTNPGFEGMSNHFKKQNGAEPVVDDPNSTMDAFDGNTTLTVTPSTLSKDIGLGSVYVLTGGTEGGPITLDELASIAIGSDGTVFVSHAEKGTVVAGKISLASFANPQGLQQMGSNYYQSTVNSGAAALTDPGEGGTGALKSSTLEMSNVDLSSEFSDMITTQRGFQANSRVITVSDTMLEELINLKR